MGLRQYLLLEGGFFMGTMYKIVVFVLLVVGFVFARSGENKSRVEANKVNSEHYWVKDHSEDNGNNQLDRKRSHKRRRKIRKPVKGLR